MSINFQASDILPVRSGVPLGSILGPLLFIMYVNDIPNYINHCTTYYFVDDAKCIQIIDQPSDCTLMQVNLSKWNDKWKLLLNSSKCCTMTFSSSTDTQSYIYRINNHPLQSLTKHKDLCLYFSSNLTWRSHLESVCATAYKQSGTYSALLNTCPTSPHSAIWDPHLI